MCDGCGRAGMVWLTKHKTFARSTRKCLAIFMSSSPFACRVLWHLFRSLAMREKVKKWRGGGKLVGGFHYLSLSCVLYLMMGKFCKFVIRLKFKGWRLEMEGMESSSYSTVEGGQQGKRLCNFVIPKTLI